ncbi:MAG: hypothetical protein AVDCRST_MAG89-3379, partial [uncultured Gemmatimonadetes bacterium]
PVLRLRARPHRPPPPGPHGRPDGGDHRPDRGPQRRRGQLLPGL